MTGSSQKVAGQGGGVLEPMYPKCKLDVAVSLWIAGRAPEIEAIARTMGAIAAPVEVEEGASRAGASSPGGLWVLRSPLPAREPLDEHLAWMLRAVSPHRGLIVSLSGHAKLSIHCELRSTSDQCGFDIAPEILRGLVSLAIPLSGSLSLVSASG